MKKNLFIKVTKPFRLSFYSSTSYSKVTHLFFLHLCSIAYIVHIIGCLPYIIYRRVTYSWCNIGISEDNENIFCANADIFKNLSCYTCLKDFNSALGRHEKFEKNVHICAKSRNSDSDSVLNRKFKKKLRKVKIIILCCLACFTSAAKVASS